jgi:hypothetical protein
MLREGVSPNTRGHIYVENTYVVSMHPSCAHHAPTCKHAAALCAYIQLELLLMAALIANVGVSNQAKMFLSINYTITIIIKESFLCTILSMNSAARE